MYSRVLAAIGALFVVATPVVAQDDPNPGGITVTAGVDVPSLYYFRGYRQEADPKLTLWPYVDVGFGLFEGEGSLKSVSVNVGVWNSLHSGSSGGDEDAGGPGGLHYEEDFYATLGLGFGGGVSLGTTYTAYTSPNGLFGTIHEVAFKVSKTHWLAPYGLVAAELADEFFEKSTYAEFGVGPSWPLGSEGGLTLTVPAKIGLGLRDFYFDDRGDSAPFGFFSVGGTVVVPLGVVPSRFGSWSVKGGVELLTLGEGTEAVNLDGDGDTSKTGTVGFFGIGFTY